MKKDARARAIDLSGLDAFNVSSLMVAGVPEHKDSTGKPLELPLDSIVEDPNQPRSEKNPGFSRESLNELAKSIIQSRGVKAPVSVQPVNADGKYIINHGARRFRASKIAGMETIKAFIDDTHDDYDQAIENIQRESFTPMEIALFIAKRERLNDTRVSIAERLGKSKSFVTQHAALLSMPDELREIYDKGRCRDVLVLYELNNLHKKSPEAVLDFLANSQEISRPAVELLKSSLREPEVQKAKNSAAGEVPEEPEKTSLEKGAGTRQEKSTIMVKWQDRLYVLRADIRPSALHLGWIEDSNSMVMSEVELAELIIDSIVL